MRFECASSGVWLWFSAKCLLRQFCAAPACSYENVVCACFVSRCCGECALCACLTCCFVRNSLYRQSYASLLSKLTMTNIEPFGPNRNRNRNWNRSVSVLVVFYSYFFIRTLNFGIFFRRILQASSLNISRKKLDLILKSYRENSKKCQNTSSVGFFRLAFFRTSAFSVFCRSVFKMRRFGIGFKNLEVARLWNSYWKKGSILLFVSTMSMSQLKKTSLTYRDYR